ncbi:hypothetical protein COW36_00420 [bacterium (Candidatus Blackallbacteria) CG17_big_fil_post_rev_8_21_14_2_50_48_46]|uniref:Uncharacterized protein n=1 Tax=bacterium (Candidatus Blackallbacteria) CG17_big_fil_post_rev_8_21_14_2_50_48_46 TaxID=2014261 RepID=A0A2M7GAY4_9BACT|nr:MAG: hypothetical protein COW64_10750 [bacterium (Candidatus Blackallbacteria) CG18_big_fil_WC_8_21_14_2_50_49_26]PIW19337.1 MAG: hypothetical protein COW36_00420 [bacterium (Candidatus Blackallbacteria) CG17_big_fil_post_rev_8_21_14_2_50_48_46]PIW49059.1 MAG: hypothetical protein COW20_08035 [bacterium (Candidatus Blackallbacteria) CG13_big_fil_rev_8_21_14_2_50_49_14]
MNQPKKQLPAAFFIPPMLLGVSVLIFFLPWVTQQKVPATEQAVEQNMVFFKEMVDKYISLNHKIPQSIKELYDDAKKNNYNKTFFNPILKHSGDMTNLQIVKQYTPEEIININPSFSSPLYAGKTGYFPQATHYTIYGHSYEGKLLMRNSKLFQLGNY